MTVLKSPQLEADRILRGDAARVAARREYAIGALQGLIASHIKSPVPVPDKKQWAHEALDWADAMLEAEQR